MITIETLDEQKYTVVWHSEAFCKMEGILENKEPSWFWQPMQGGGYCLFINRPRCNSHEATALPALPRKPKMEDVWLLHLYMAHGISLFGTVGGRFNDCGILAYIIGGNALPDITHATLNGERVEIAIEESK